MPVPYGPVALPAVGTTLTIPSKTAFQLKPYVVQVQNNSGYYLQVEYGKGPVIMTPFSASNLDCAAGIAQIEVTPTLPPGGTAPAGVQNLVSALFFNPTEPVLAPSPVFPSIIVASPATATVTAAQSSVASSASDELLLAANTSRIGASVYNDSTANLFLLCGTGPSSSTVFTVKLPAAGYYEIPFGWQGQVRGLWDAVNGAARITEFHT